MNKRNILLLITVLIAVATASAQTVSNVTSEQVNKTILVSYDLDKQADITLFLSTDGGSTYTQLYRVSGDVGKNVSAGHKTIVWDVLAEREKLVGDNIVFKVKAQGDKTLRTEEPIISYVKVQDGWEFTVKGVTFKMVYVEGGTFTMGCTSEQGGGSSDEKPTHRVTLSNYYIGETEVTQALWKAVMGSEPSYNGGWTYEYGKGDSYPAYRVSWDDCQQFIQKLNQLTGKTFRLPTEAQWEYAARGGKKSKGYKYSGSNTLGNVAWYDGNSGYATHPVKTKAANELGLYDMSGNVYEWCADWYGSYNGSPQTNPTGPNSGSYRVVRGGNWGRRASGCRVAYRNRGTPDYHYNNIGVRLSLVQ